MWSRKEILEEMKILACGDLHITNQKPVNRTDNYWETLTGKLDWIFKLANDRCDLVLLPGDVFDTHRANDFLKQHLIKTIIKYNMECATFAVYGQHDLRHHGSDRSNTPLNVLNVAAIIDILSSAPIMQLKDLYGELAKVKKFEIYGASFGEDIPTPIDKYAFNVLVTHRMIIEDKLWEGQEDFQRVNILLRNTEYDLIVSGDNHSTIFQQTEDKTLINCGSLMRSKINQEEHKPCVFTFDTKTRKAEQHFIPIKPFEEVMDLTQAISVKERDERMESFVDTLSGEIVLEGMIYKDNMKQYIEEKKVPKGVQDVIWEALP